MRKYVCCGLFEPCLPVNLFADMIIKMCLLPLLFMIHLDLSLFDVFYEEKIILHIMSALLDGFSCSFLQ